MVDVKTINIKLPDYVAGESVIVNTADADIVAADVANGKIAYGANGRIVGTHECTGGGITDGIVATYTGGNVTNSEGEYTEHVKIINLGVSNGVCKVRFTTIQPPTVDYLTQDWEGNNVCSIGINTQSPDYNHFVTISVPIGSGDAYRACEWLDGFTIVEEDTPEF